MKDPIVLEVRKHRMEHTRQFNSDIHLICEDLRKFEATLGARLVNPEPKRVLPAKITATEV
ncbi:MAG: hypothetical protein GY862_00125 [Gammaproteobacteria bacterium]|nr:hypothetical protein [Gammaproteobacteria bacterium]